MWFFTRIKQEKFNVKVGISEAFRFKDRQVELYFHIIMILTNSISISVICQDDFLKNHLERMKILTHCTLKRA